MGQDITSIMKAIAEFGVLIVIAAIFLYVAIRLINLGFKHAESKIGAKKHDDLLVVRTEVSREIQLLLDTFLEKHDGDRVHVIEFSNSVTSVAYLPFKYMTCTYEVYRLGKAPTGHLIDHVSTSLFTTFFNSMQDQPYRLFDINDKTLPMGGAKYDLVQAQGTSQSLCCMMHTSKGKAIGYVTMKKAEHAFTEEDFEGIQTLANEISVLLSVADM